MTAAEANRFARPEDDSDHAIVVSELWKSFRIYHQRAHTLKETLLARRSKYEEFWALKGISFTVPKGEMLGVIGPNGSGKSTLLKCLARILMPDAGQIKVNGSLSSLLELGTGFHPDLSGRENVYLAGSILGLRRDEIDGQFDTILDFSGLHEFIDTPIKNYSSGMTARLAFSVAISIDPEVLLVDEVLAVGDEAFQLKCYERIWQLRRAGKTVVFVSHSLDAVRRLCSKVLWIEKGRAKAFGPADEVVGLYLERVRKAEAQARGEMLMDGSTRWGSERVRIDSFEVIGKDGDPTSIVRSGDPVTFRINYSSDIEADPVVITLKFYRADSDQLISGVNSTTNPRPQKFKVMPGKGRFEYSVPALPLWRGTFAVTVGIGDDVGAVSYDWRSKEFSFMVVPANFGQGDGAIFMTGDWNMVQT